MKLILRFLAFLWVASIIGAIAVRVARRETELIPDPDADDVRLSAILGPLSFHSTARAFRGGTLDCWYGGGVVDLRDAQLHPEGARLLVRALFGGGQILVPESWSVVSTVRGVGGLSDSRPARERPADAPLLAIEGPVLFGGFSVSSTMSEARARGLEQATAWQERHRPVAID